MRGRRRGNRGFRYCTVLEELTMQEPAFYGHGTPIRCVGVLRSRILTEPMRTKTKNTYTGTIEPDLNHFAESDVMAGRPEPYRTQPRMYEE